MCKDMASVMAQRRNIIQSSNQTRETIHSGHFMVSHFEADAQDDEYEVAVPVPEVSSKKLELIPLCSSVHKNVNERHLTNAHPKVMSVSIETSLTKLFQCMSIAYRQKLTSPKWNRFRGVRLRWKEKIRLNNVIWRCWHMQFVKRRNIGVCQFASPLDVDIHSKPEAVVLEGKYWKRKLSAVTAEYKRWRIFYQKLASSPARDQCDMLAELTEWSSGSLSLAHDDHMMMDEDYMDFMSDTLFSTIAANQPFAFPDTREIARAAGLADLIQPSLVQLQPHLDDFMDLNLIPDLLSPPNKLPSVPEEYQPSDDLYRPLNNYADVCNTPSFYPQSSTSSAVNSAGGVTSVARPSESMEQKMYVKMEQDQPLQLSVAAHNLSQKTQSNSSYRGMDGGTMYHNSNPAPMYSSLSGGGGGGGGDGATSDGAASAAYNSYHAQNYQTGQLAGQENAIINYSHQMNKNMSAQNASVSYNNNCHYSSSYDSTANCYAPSSNVTSHHQEHQQQGYSPSSSSNYKILPSSRAAKSNSLSTNNEEELFAVPKLTQQRGRSRSGSSLLNVHARCLPNDAEAVSSCALLSQLLSTSPSSRYSLDNGGHYGYPNGYGMNGCTNAVAAAAGGHYGGIVGSVHDIRTCYAINGHREMAHCTALVGRRSRTPDHVLSSNSNTLGYCVPRTPTPVLSSQNNDYHEGSLINLSQSQRERSAVPETVAEEHDQADGHSAFGYSSRPSLYGPLKSEPEKYSNSSAFHAQNWNTTGPYASSISSSSSVANNPFIFTGNQHSNPESSTLSQLISSQASTSSSPKHPSSPSTSESLSLSPLTVSSPGTSTSPTIKTSHSNTPYKEHRRVCHINAEQKRRCNIKNGFDTLHQLIPHLAQNPNMKMSKAAMLQKGADYIRTLRGDRSQIRDEIESLKQQVETLNLAISNCQSLLPATGAPVSRRKADKMKEMFDEYVKERTRQNWKFWILSLICEPLLTSFNSSVSNTNIEELFRTTVQWAEQYCSLVDLRPVVLNALRNVCTSTEILSNPNQLPDEARAIVLQNSSSSTMNSNRN